MPIITGADDQVFHFIDDSGQPGQIARAALTPEMQAELQASVPQGPATPAGSGIEAMGAGGIPGVQVASAEPAPALPAAMPPTSMLRIMPGAGQVPAQDPNVIDYGKLLPDGGGNTVAPASSSPEQTSPAPAAPSPGRVDPSQLALPASKAPDSNVTSRIKAIEGGYQQAGQGIEHAAQAGMARANAQAHVQDVLAQDLQRQQIMQQKRESERQAEVDGQIQKFNELATEIKSAKVDPNHYWAEKSTGDKVMAAIGVGLGAIGAALTGSGQNAALHIIQTAIDRDIDAQKANLSKKGQDLQNQGTLIAMTRAKFGDARQAEAAARAIAIEGAQVRIQQIAAKYSAPEMKANAEKLMGELEVEKNKAMMAFQQIADQNAAMKQLSQGGPIDATNLPEDVRKRYVPGVGLALTEQDAKDVKTTKDSVDKMGSAVNKLIEIRKSIGSGTLFDRKTVAEAKQLATDVLLQYKNIAQLGVMSKSDQELLDRIIPEDPTRFEVTGSTLAQLEQLKNRVEQGYRQYLENRGLRSRVTSFQPR